MEPAAAPAGEDLGGYLQGVELARAIGRAAIADMDSLEGHVVGHDLAMGRRGVRLRSPEGGQLLVGLDGPEVALDRLDDRGLVDIAGHREHGVVGHVVGAEEGLHVLERRGVEILHRADGRVMVGMSGGEDRRHQLLVEGAVGSVVVGLALLVLDHVTLVVEVLLRHRVEQRGHAIRFEPQAQLDLVRGQRLEVVGAVEVGGGVEHAAGSLHDREVLRLGHVAAALEHEVLEEVGEPGLARLLVLGADVVPEVDGDDRRYPVGRDDDAQSVGERVLAEADVDGAAHRGRRVTALGIDQS